MESFLIKFSGRNSGWTPDIVQPKKGFCPRENLKIKNVRPLILSYFFLSATWLPHCQLWTTVELKASIGRSLSLCFQANFDIQ